MCAIAIKAATAKRAVLTLCELGDGDNALIVARVLLENACLFEWLIRGEGRRRLETYVMFTSVTHERIINTVDRHKDRFVSAGADPGLVSDPYHGAIWSHTFGGTRSSRPTWEFDRATGKRKQVSVNDLFFEIAGGNHSFEYDVLYGAIGSDIVHTGPFSLTRTLQAIGNRHTFILQPTPIADPCTIALASSNVAMFLVFDSLTEYIGLDLSRELAPLKARFHADPHAPTLGEPETDQNSG